MNLLRTQCLQQVVTASQLGIWEWNMQTGEFNFSEEWAGMVGYTAAELPLKHIDTWRRFVLPDDKKQSDKQLENYLNGKTRYYACEVRLQHKNGSIIWVLDKGSVITYTSDGKPEWIIGSQQELTEAKNSYYLLERYKDSLSRTYQKARIGTWEIHPLTNKIFWDSTAKEMLGLTSHSADEWQYFIPNFLDEPYVSEINNALDEVIHSEGSFDIDIQLRKTYNGMKWARIIGYSEFEQGVCKRIFGLFLDITEKKKTSEQLFLQEQLFQKIFDYTPVGMALISLAGNWLKINKSITQILGYTEQELSSITFREITHPEDIDKDMALLNEVLSGIRSSYQIEKRYYHKKGNIVWALLSVSLIKNNRQEPLHFVSQIIDINPLKTLQEQIEDQNKRLLNFAYIASHNLRSHSSNFISLLELMKEDMPESTENEYYNLLVQASQNMQETIQHLNTIAKIQTTMPTQFEELNLSEYVEKATANVKALAINAHCSIINQVADNIVIIAIPAYLDSILLNFLTNAIKYKDPERNCTILLQTEIKNDFAALSIQDNGMGMNLEKMGNQLFVMNKTFHNHNDARGVGLFITKNQIEALGGRVEVNSEVNKGTCFTIFFRYKRPAFTLVNTVIQEAHNP